VRLRFKSAMLSGLVLTCLVSLLSGCNIGNQAGGVAVLDLDAVAVALGREKSINDQVQAYASEQETRLKSLQQSLQQQVTEAGGKLAADASDQDKRKVAEMVGSARTQLAGELAKARREAVQLRRKLVHDLAVEVEPVARRVADARGMQIVMLKQPSLLVVGPGADITDAVIDDMQTQSTTKAGSAPDATK
jgi:Skp family chaperone for outer membrane proteins